AQRKHQARGFAPPDAQINDPMKSARCVGKLSLVNNEAGLMLASQYLRNDVVERNRDGGDIRIEDLQREVGARKDAGNRHADMLQVVDGKLAPGNNHGAVALAHAATASHQQVIALHVRIGVKADGGYVE